MIYEDNLLLLLKISLLSLGGSLITSQLSRVHWIWLHYSHTKSKVASVLALLEIIDHPWLINA